MPCPDIDFYTRSCPIAYDLAEENYPTIRHHMLDEDGHQANLRLNIVDLLGDRRRELIAANVGVHRVIEELLCDTSFAQQMHAVYAQRPDSILATFRSAAPTLWAVKAFYDSAGIPTPQLDVVDVSRELHSDRGATDKQLMAKFENETHRLSNIVFGRHVVVIDEYYEHGTALWRAGRIVQNAGAVSVHGMLGRWYKTISDNLRERDAVIAAHRDFMTDIGHLAADISPQEKPPSDLVAIAEEFDDDYYPYYGGVDHLIPLNKIRTSIT